MAAKKAVLERNTETAGQKFFFVNDKNSWNSAKTALFLDLNFLFQKKYSESRFWRLVLATKTALFFCIWILYFRKNKMKVSFGCKKSSFWEKTATAVQKYFFVNDKNSWNSSKTALFSGSEFFISEKIKWKSVLDTGFGYENSSFFCTKILYFRKK